MLGALCLEEWDPGRSGVVAAVPGVHSSPAAEAIIMVTRENERYIWDQQGCASKEPSGWTLKYKLVS